MKICIAYKIVEGPWGGGNSFSEQLGLQLTNFGHAVVYDLGFVFDVIVIIDL